MKQAVSVLVVLFVSPWCFAADAPFSTDGILPKTEIGAIRFLKEHPEYDGHGVVVAVFDTGVDPGVPGLSTTPGGQTKIIDMIDGTGSGDVDTATVVVAKENLIEGLSGRPLKVDPKWKNPSGKFHIGLKPGFDLFSQSLVGRLKRERRKIWEKAQAKAVGALRLEIAGWDKKHPKPTSAEKLTRDDLKARLKALENTEKTYDDPGPVYDCVVFYDGMLWRAVVDTDEDGDLAEETLLTNYRVEQQFASFNDGSAQNFAVNIYDDGNLLSIVTDSGAHATHVAGIIAGYYPEEPELNGIAPGAQIVSVKIGDNRINSMETATGLMRGLKAVLDNNCDLINMSYGETNKAPNKGWLTKQFTEIVNEHGVIFVASAGNAGPALSTVGAPGGTTSAVLGVGAYVSPAMMRAEYALREALPEMPYTWSSRGPTADGDWGVDIFAPGGAIAPIPQWSQRRSMQMNGTSMASPNACGAVALLVSALKASDIPYSPYSVRRALQNSAKWVDGTDVFAQGAGLLQVDLAWEYLETNKDESGELLHFEVQIPSRQNARGIYLRKPADTEQPFVAEVRVRPQFPEIDTESADYEDQREERLDFELRIELEVTESWVTCGQQLLLSSGGESFEVRVDATDLEPGLHMAVVRAFDSSAKERGPLFRLPITVIRPLEVSEEDGLEVVEEVDFAPGQLERRFFSVPEGATWATLRLTQHSDGSSRTFVVHRSQELGARPDSSLASREYLTLQEGVETVRSLPVVAGETLELNFAQYWSSLGESTLEYELAFHGLLPREQNITLLPGTDGTELAVSSQLRAERLAPRATLKWSRRILSPRKAEIQLLNAERDSTPGGNPLYALLLEYRWEQSAKGNATFRFPQLDELLYEAPVAPFLWMLFDSGKQRVATGDIYADTVKLQQGPHLLRLRIFHDDPKKLEEYDNLSLSLEQSLPSVISLDIYVSRAEAALQGARFPSSVLNVGDRATFFVSAPSKKKLPKNSQPRDILFGNISFASDSGNLGAGARPGGYPLALIVPPASKDEPATATSAPIKLSTAERLNKELREFRISQLKKIDYEKDRAAFRQLAASIFKDAEDDLPVQLVHLHKLDNVKHRKERLREVVEEASDAISMIDTEKLARHFSTNVNPDDPQAKATRQEMEKLREILVDTLYRKGRALGYMELPDVIAKHPIKDKAAHEKAFEDNFAELRKWVETTDKKYFLLHIRRERRKDRDGNALELLNKYIPISEPNYWYIKKRRDIYEKLGWKHLWEQEANRLLIHFPKKYEAF